MKYTIDNLPDEVKAIMAKYDNQDDDWKAARECADELRAAGYRCTEEYGEIFDIEKPEPEVITRAAGEMRAALKLAERCQAEIKHGFLFVMSIIHVEPGRTISCLRDTEADARQAAEGRANDLGVSLRWEN